MTTIGSDGHGTDDGRQPTIDSQELRGMLGDVDDERLVEIIALRPSRADIEVALAWAAAESDVMGEARKPLTGIAAEVYEILCGDSEFEDDRS